MKDFYIKQLSIALCVYLGQVLVGYGMGWTAPVIPKLRDPDLTPLPEVPTEGQTSWVASVLYIGCIIGPYISGYISNKFGRKASLILGGGLTAISFIILATSVNIAMVYAGRIVKGFGIGILAVMNLVYLGEIASTSIRGIVLTGTGIFGTCGTLIIYSAGPYVSYAMTSYIGLGMTVAYIVGIVFVPETPVFYVLQGKEKNAQDTLIALGRLEDINKVLSTKIQADANAVTDWTEILTIRSNRNALSITLTLNILQQLSGVVVVVFFATTIFELAGSTINPNLATIIIGVTQFVAGCITPFFVERSGRKIILLVSTMACFVSLGVLGIYFYFYEAGYEVEKVGWIPLATLIAFFLSYDLGFGIIPSTFTGEMFRNNVRSSGSAVTITVAWLCGFGVSTAFGYMITGIGGAFTFCIFAAACGVAFLFTLFFVPETKGKTLLEIQEMLGK